MNAYADQMARSVAALNSWCNNEMARQWVKRHYLGLDSRSNPVSNHLTQPDPRCPVCAHEDEYDGMLAELQEISEQR
jgi:hypothetical protein